MVYNNSQPIRLTISLFNVIINTQSHQLSQQIKELLIMDEKDEVLKTIYEWAEEYNSTLFNTDGFRNDIDWKISKVSNLEFLSGASRCTMELSPEITEAFNEMRMRFAQKTYKEWAVKHSDLVVPAGKFPKHFSWEHTLATEEQFLAMATDSAVELISNNNDSEKSTK